ncbi:hypothetical protein NSQ89_19210 [Niallia sp. FSL R7-0648]|uniref:hypothetical protein n=1 Tax=Niallia sp. FSL R7-0648 TaxID=2954521 RepID=UPI0030F79576
MKNILLIVALALTIFVIYLIAMHPNPTKTVFIPPISSLEERVCEEVSEQFGDCKRILLFDAQSRIVFAENRSGIVPVLTNKEFTDFQKIIYPILEFQEFQEERQERGTITWQANNKLEKNFSIIYGFAEDSAKTIIITSEGNIQPNKFFLQDNLWVWYATFPKDNVKLPVEVDAYE